MPIMEFEGNESWGYNTAYHMALVNYLVKTTHPDKLRPNYKRQLESTKDDTGNFTLDNSIQAYNNNKTKINMGVQIRNSDLDALYQFSK